MVENILYQCFVFGVPLAVAAALYGMRWKEGFWGNIIAVPAVFFSMLVAIGWWESLASFISTKVNAMLWVSDFLALWILFLLSLLIIGEVTRALSRVKVKFADPVEKGGNALALTLLFALIMGFYQFSMDLAPMGKTADDIPPNAETIQVQAFRLLTGGNLGSFTNPKRFDDFGDFRQIHFQRQQELLKYRLAKEGTMFYEGAIPPRRN